MHDEQAIWVISTLSGDIRKVRDDATGATPSPDGLRLAFLNGTGTEIWITGLEGQEPRRVAATDPEFRFTRVEWSSDGRRLTYMKYRQGGTEAVLESIAAKGGGLETLISDQRIRDFCLLPDGTVLFARWESPHQMASNLWDLTVDPLSGRPVGQPRRITDWSGFSITYLSASANGQRVSFIRSRPQSDVYLGDLKEKDTRLDSVRRLTLDDSIDWPGGWDRQGQAILFYSDRNGNLDLFRQNIGQRNAETIVAGPEEERGPQLSPDGAWILYWTWPEAQGAIPPKSGRLMRLPISGGSPEVVLEVRGYPGSAQVGHTLDPVGLSSMGFPDFRCGSRPGTPCVLAEVEGGQLVFSEFDAVHGRGRQLFRPNTSPLDAFWDLSSDGNRIALGRTEMEHGGILIFGVDGGHPVPVLLSNWRHLKSVAWSADGKSLFATSWASHHTSLLHATLNGQTQVLHTSSIYLERPLPSPDGRHLAFAEVTCESNAWMITNFR